LLAQDERQGIAINLARDALFCIHDPAFEARHAIPIFMVGHVEDHEMGMKMRVEFAAAMFRKAGHQNAPRRFVEDLAFSRLRS
jgi:hypothetical protein